MKHIFPPLSLSIIAPFDKAPIGHDEAWGHWFFSCRLVAHPWCHLRAWPAHQCLPADPPLWIRDHKREALRRNAGRGRWHDTGRNPSPAGKSEGRTSRSGPCDPRARHRRDTRPVAACAPQKTQIIVEGRDTLARRPVAPRHYCVTDYSEAGQPCGRGAFEKKLTLFGTKGIYHLILAFVCLPGVLQRGTRPMR